MLIDWMIVVPAKRVFDALETRGRGKDAASALVAADRPIRNAVMPNMHAAATTKPFLQR